MAIMPVQCFLVFSIILCNFWLAESLTCGTHECPLSYDCCLSVIGAPDELSCCDIETNWWNIWWIWAVCIVVLGCCSICCFAYWQWGRQRRTHLIIVEETDGPVYGSVDPVAPVILARHSGVQYAGQVQPPPYINKPPNYVANG